MSIVRSSCVFSSVEVSNIFNIHESNANGEFGGSMTLTFLVGNTDEQKLKDFESKNSFKTSPQQKNRDTL